MHGSGPEFGVNESARKSYSTGWKTRPSIVKKRTGRKSSRVNGNNKPSEIEVLDIRTGLGGKSRIYAQKPY